MNDSKMAVRDNERFGLLDNGRLKEELAKVRQFQALVKKLMIKEVDYGVIPGTGDKPTLLKPGAEKLNKMHGLADRYEITEKTEDYRTPFFCYTVKCTLTHINSGEVISEGLGSCNSMESKYRYRWIGEKKLPKDFDKEADDVVMKVGQYGNVYRLDNDDVCSQVNTIMKMAKKRALVDATLSACRLSSVFTQDFDDVEDVPDAAPQKPAGKPPVDMPKAKSEAAKPAEQQEPSGGEEPLSVQEAQAMAVGASAKAITGTLEGWKEKKTKTNKDVTYYNLMNGEANLIIGMWGKKTANVKENDIVVFGDVTVTEYNGEKRYSARSLSAQIGFGE